MNLLTVQVARRSVEAQDIVSVELRDPGRSSLPAFSAGCHIDVHINPGLIRPYSLCNHPAERDRYLIAVLKEPNSRGGSVAVHETLRAGDLIRVSLPRNNFPLVPGRGALLFAGGIGITPLMSMAHQLGSDGTPFHMHYYARSRERAAFASMLSGGCVAGPVSFHFGTPPEDVQLNIRTQLAAAPDGTHLYVCGPSAFINAVLDGARQAGWDESRVHYELFATDPSRRSAAGADRAFDVRLASSGRTVRVRETESVAQALAREGIRIPVACEQGVCGTCVTRLIEGVPDHRDMYLTKEERAGNDQFTPCCSRAHGSLLVLDL